LSILLPAVSFSLGPFLVRAPCFTSCVFSLILLIRRRHAMPTILSIPPEVLLEIFNIAVYTHPHDQWRMYKRLEYRCRRLSRLSIVHSTFTPIARFLLVQEVDLCRGYRPEDDGDLKRLDRILRTSPWNSTHPKYLILAGANRNREPVPLLFKDPSEIGSFAGLVWIRCRPGRVDITILSFIKSTLSMSLGLFTDQ